VARRPRADFPGVIHHVTARGDRREPIFVDDTDREQLLSRLALIVGRFELTCTAYCLMPNHYHVLLQATRGDLARAMQQLNGWYTQAFNRRHGTVGHVFQGRYHATPVRNDSHLLELSRYIVLNPVRAGLCAEPSSWRWSSYRATAGLSSAPVFVRTDAMLGLFGANRRDAAERYRAFVRDGSQSGPTAGELGVVGATRIREGPVDSRGREPQPDEMRHRPLRPTLAELFACHGDTASVVAHRSHGYAMREIGAYLGLAPSTVSRRIARLERAAMLRAD
jgi:REP element-mobilizing transposase RayT